MIFLDRFAIITMPNKLNNGVSVVFRRGTIPISATNSYEFAKNANPGELVDRVIALLRFNLFGDNRGCVFECGSFGCRTFLFSTLYREMEVVL